MKKTSKNSENETQHHGGTRQQHDERHYRVISCMASVAAVCATWRSHKHLIGSVPRKLRARADEK